MRLMNMPAGPKEGGQPQPQGQPTLKNWSAPEGSSDQLLPRTGHAKAASTQLSRLYESTVLYGQPTRGINVQPFEMCPPVSMHNSLERQCGQPRAHEGF